MKKDLTVLKKLNPLNWLKNLSIGVKMSISMALVLILALGTTAVISYAQSRKALCETMEESMSTKAKDMASIVAINLNQYKQTIETLAPSEQHSSGNLQDQLQILKDNSQMIGNNFAFDIMGIGDADGNVTLVTGQKENLGNNKAYKVALSNTSATMSTLYDDQAMKGKYYLFVRSFFCNGHMQTIVGLLGSQVVNSLFSDTTVKQNGYAFMVDTSGTIVASRNADQVSSGENFFNDYKKDKSLTELNAAAENITSGITGYSTVVYNHQKMDMAYTTIFFKGANWPFSVGIIVPESELYATTNVMERIIILCSILFALVSIVLAMLISGLLVTRPLRKTVGMINEMAAGHLGGRLKVKTRDEVGRMSAAMNALADNLQIEVVGTMRRISQGDTDIEIVSRDEQDEVMPALATTVETITSIIGSTKGIINAARQGRLDERSSSEGYQGNWKLLVDEINGLMDSVAAPINEVRNVIGLISQNDYTCKVSGEYQGLFKELAEDVNGLCGRLAELQDTLVEVSRGDTSSLAEYENAGRLSENDNMTPSVTQMMKNIDNLINEVRYLAEQSTNGNVIKARGEVDKFEGGYREIIEGFNSALEAVSRPLSEVMKVLDAMALNDYTTSVGGEYVGDFAEIVDALSGVQKQLLEVQNVAVKISRGDISALEEYRTMGKHSENDRIVPALTQMMESIKRLITETMLIANSASEGNLSVRGDETKFEGEYVSIIRSINHFLDAVEQPTSEIRRVMTEIANSSFDVKIEGEYKGEFQILIDAVNKTAQTLKGIVSGITSVLTEIANGNFGIARIEEYDGDFNEISKALNNILDSFNELFGAILNSSEEVASGTRQISEGSQSVSQGATEQASAIEQLTASIGEVASQTKQNATNANQANTLVSAVKEKAASGNTEMNGMLNAITEIDNSSKNISKIIKVIDDIAFQTNMLAINAAVEAARAGQAGKGFAVVAEEVRNLAGHSADAARETSDMIEGSVRKVTEGTKIAENTAKMLTDIVGGVDKVADLVGNISLSSNEQATGIAQINKGIEQVSQVVQSNSATAEESASASVEISSQADQLKEMVARFRIRSDVREHAGYGRLREAASARAEHAAAEYAAAPEQKIEKPVIKLEQGVDAADQPKAGEEHNAKTGAKPRSKAEKKSKRAADKDSADNLTDARPAADGKTAESATTEGAVRPAESTGVGGEGKHPAQKDISDEEFGKY